MNKRKEIINWTLLILWMGLIFVMSNQPASISDSQSGGVISILARFGIDMNNIFGEIANFIVRKCAHFLEYMILAALAYNVAKSYTKVKGNAVIIVLFVFLYACSDEFHQLFVDGREGAFRDVVIDTCGGITSVMLIYLKKYLYKIRLCMAKI